MGRADVSQCCVGRLDRHQMKRYSSFYSSLYVWGRKLLLPEKERKIRWKTWQRALRCLHSQSARCTSLQNVPSLPGGPSTARPPFHSALLPLSLSHVFYHRKCRESSWPCFMQSHSPKYTSRNKWQEGTFTIKAWKRNSDIRWLLFIYFILLRW